MSKKIIPDEFDVSPQAKDAIARLLEAGAHALSDSEVEDHGAYVLWKNLDLENWAHADSVPLFVSDLDDATAVTGCILGAANGIPVVFYPGKPLRLRLFVALPDTGGRSTGFIGALWRVGKDGSQAFAFSVPGERDCSTRVDGVTKTGRAWLSLYTGTACRFVQSMGDMPAQYRDEYRALLSASSMKAGAFLSNRRASLSFHAGYLRYVRWPAMFSAGVPALLKKYGTLVSDMMRGESNAPEALSVLGDILFHMGETYTCSILDRSRWNEECGLGDEIELCLCGHVDFEDASEQAVVGGEVGHICSGCAESDEYVVPEDDDCYYPTNDLYEHEYGCMYTYPEERDEDEYESEDGEAYNGVKSYGTNVLRYMVRDASIKPSPYGDFLLGIELEVAPHRGSVRGCISRTQTDLCPDYAILKHDGSLEGGDEIASGFEIVTAPRGLAEHIARFKAWKPHEDLIAWDAGCCGMHVHISSQAFSPATLGKFIEFINSPANDDLIREIAGRHPKWNHQAASYCQREGGLVLGNPSKTTKNKRLDRYHMVNTQNLGPFEARRLGMDVDAMDFRDDPYDTVELRIFRATLNKKRLLAQIEFAHAAVMFCRWSSMRALGRADFVGWLHEAAGMYPNLARWFGVQANKLAVEEKPKARLAAEV